MNQTELTNLLREIVAEELNEWDEPGIDFGGDGYTNDHQRAYAHSQATTPRHNDTKKAIELAKQGKFVVVVRDDVHCQTTDAVLGQCVSIHKVFDDHDSAYKEAEKLHNSGQEIGFYTPDSVKPKTYKDPEPLGPDDVPFQEGSVKPNNRMVKEVNGTTDYSTGKRIIAQGAPGSVVRFATEHPDVMVRMRDWAKDCSWRDVSCENDIDEMSDEEILRGIQNNYEGGIKQFIDDDTNAGSVVTAEVPVGYKEGYGMGDMSKDPKKAFKGARWTVKFNESVNRGNCGCGGSLKYTADIGAPGTGQSWECQKCKKGYIKLGNQFIDPQNVDPKEAPPWELDPSDVMENKITMKEFKRIVKSLINEMWVGWEEKKNVNEARKAQEVQGQPLTSSHDAIMKLILSLGEGQILTLTTAPKAYNYYLFFGMEARNEDMEWIHGGRDEDYGRIESEEELEQIVKQVNLNRYKFYDISTNQDYVKSSRTDRIDYDDPTGQDTDYDYPPDRPQPQFEIRQLHEAKGMTPKEKLRSILKESVTEVLNEYSEQNELQIIKSIASIARTANSKISGLQPYEVQQAFREIDRLAAILVKMHDEGKGYDVPIKAKEEKTALGVTQETISKTKNLLDSMLSQRRKK